MQDGLDHEFLGVYEGRRSSVRFAIAIHSRASSGISLGGCRIGTYRGPDELVAEALGLARAMTYKCAAVGLAHGGAKCVVADPGDLTGDRRQDALHDVGEALNSLGGRVRTGKDAGTTMTDVATLSRFSPHIIGRPVELGGSGDPSEITGVGVCGAIEASATEAFGEASLRGRRIAILGLGGVGASLAGHLAEKGAELVVADIDDSKHAVAERVGATWVDPGALLSEPADILAPCALGGVLTPSVVAGLRCRIVAGAANNQLADDRVADLLRRRGILWAPDFIANAGGVIGVAAEVDGYDQEEAARRTAAIAECLGLIFRRARERNETTLEAARAYARQRTRVAQASARS